MFDHLTYLGSSCFRKGVDSAMERNFWGRTRLLSGPEEESRIRDGGNPLMHNVWRRPASAYGIHTLFLLLARDSFGCCRKQGSNSRRPAFPFWFGIASPGLEESAILDKRCNVIRGDEHGRGSSGFGDAYHDQRSVLQASGLVSCSCAEMKRPVREIECVKPDEYHPDRRVN
jgi:hypothetical protein